MPILKILDERGCHRPDANLVVSAAMLAPDDKPFREQYRSYIRLRGFESKVTQAGITPSMLTDARLFAERSEQRQQALSRARAGRSAGDQLLVRMALAIEGAPGARLATARRILDHSGSPMGNKGMQAAWQRYESVAHLWVAAVLRERRFGAMFDPNPDHATRDLDIFLGQSEYIRRRSIELVPELNPIIEFWKPPRDWHSPQESDCYVRIPRLLPESRQWETARPPARQRGRKARA